MSKKANKILILHGWGASSEDHWFMAAKDYFEKKNFQVFVPDLGGNYFPKLENWTKIIDQYKPDKDWILIGHSLGGVAILNFLESSQEKISQAILVATPFEDLKFGAIANFFEGDFDWAKIKQNCFKFDLIYEDEDPMIPLEHGKKFAEELSGKLHIVKGCLHCHEIDLKLLEKIIN